MTVPELVSANGVLDQIPDPRTVHRFAAQASSVPLTLNGHLLDDLRMPGAEGQGSSTDLQRERP